MARQPVLSPTKAALLMLGIGTVSLMGIPGFGTDVPPVGAMAGVVLDHEGGTLPGVEVALFDGATLDLMEISVTDELGRFAFQQAPWVHHVLANPATDTGFVPRWEVDRERSDPGLLELGLTPGHRTRVEVVDTEGATIPGVELRVVDSYDGHVVSRCLTDAEGAAQVVLPEQFHFGALATSQGYAPYWIVDGRTTELAEGTLRLELEPGVWHEGRVATADEVVLDGVVVSAWDPADGEWRWLGYDLTRADGSFRVLGTERTHLRALDPEQAVLPGAWDVNVGDGPLDLVVEDGETLLLQCSRSGGDAASRVWVYDEVRGLWSWGSTTEDDGTLAVQTSGNETTIRAEPLSGPGEALVQTVTPEPGTPLVLEGADADQGR